LASNKQLELLKQLKDIYKDTGRQRFRHVSRVARWLSQKYRTLAVPVSVAQKYWDIDTCSVLYYYHFYDSPYL